MVENASFGYATNVCLLCRGLLEFARLEERNNRMRAPKVYAVSALITIFTLLAAGYAQTSSARTGLEAINSQDASPKPSNSGERRATGTLPNSANNPGQAAPGGKIGRLSPGQRTTPATPAAADQNSPLVTAPLESQSGIPQSALFELFFNNMSVLNQVADKDDKAGDHISAAAWRTHDQRAAGLNDAEGQILWEITLDCIRILKENDAKIRALAERDRAQMTPGVISPASVEMIQTFEDRKKIISDHIERLREALGDASFNKLDTYVHSLFHAEVIAPKPATPSTTPTEKSQKESR